MPPWGIPSEVILTPQYISRPAGQWHSGHWQLELDHRWNESQSGVLEQEENVDQTGMAILGNGDRGIFAKNGSLNAIFK